jgi:hypothetical protein
MKLARGDDRVTTAAVTSADATGSGYMIRSAARSAPS